MTKDSGLDEIDEQILAIVQTDARISNVELARQIHLSPPAAFTRLKRLEERGYIRQYCALLDRERVGYDLLAFVHVTLDRHQSEHVEQFRAAIREMPEVLECYFVTGDYDYLLKVVVRNRQDLERFLVGTLTPAPGVGRIHTNIVFSEIKATTVLTTGNPKK